MRTCPFRLRLSCVIHVFTFLNQIPVCSGYHLTFIFGYSGVIFGSHQTLPVETTFQNKNKSLHCVVGRRSFIKSTNSVVLSLFSRDFQLTIFTVHHSQSSVWFRLKSFVKDDLMGVVKLST